MKAQTASTYIITAYQCVESRSIVGTVFLQRERYLKKCNISTCPRQQLIQDLVQFIIHNWEGNNKVILAADINEYVINGKLPKELKRIGMIEAHVKKFNLPRLASHITSSEPIDGVWVTDDVTPTEVSILPHKFSAGDHRVILVDFNLDQILERGVKICTPSIRRLIYKNKKSIENYNQLAWALLQSNKVPQCLESLETSLSSTNIELWCVKLNMLDE